MEKNELRQPHRLTLQDRKTMTVTGVSEVVSFDEETVVLNTGLGQLTVHGQALQLKNLTLEAAEVSIEGNVEAMIYQQPRQERSRLARFLR